MAQLDDYVEYLSTEVGPRPAGTEEEQQAALYISDKLKTDAGLPVSIEEFASSSNVFNVKAICSAIAFVSGLLFVIAPAVGILWLVLGVAAAAVYGLESFGNPVITRALARGASQNIVAKYKPQAPDASARSRKIILMAHYDTGRSVPGIVRTIEGSNVPIAWICFGGVVAVPVFELIRLVAPAAASALNVLLIIASIIAVLPFVREILIKVSPYSEGANCNATGTAALMEAARCVGTGSLTSDEFADAEQDYVVHDETAARDNGVVPEGAEIVYEVQETTEEPEDRPKKSEGERLATAKAAIAAFTGQPGATWSEDEIEENLEGTEYSPAKKKTVVVRKVVAAPAAQEEGSASVQVGGDDQVRVVDLTTNEDVADVDAGQDAPQETSAAVRSEVPSDDSGASVPAPQDSPSVSAVAPQAAHENAAESQGQPVSQAPTAPAAVPGEASSHGTVFAAAAAPVFESQPQKPAESTNSSVPSWYLEAQKKARRPKKETKPVQRSRFASALEEAENRGGNVFHEEVQKAYEGRMAQMREALSSEHQAQTAEQAQQNAAAPAAAGDQAGVNGGAADRRNDAITQDASVAASQQAQNFAPAVADADAVGGTIDEPAAQPGSAGAENAQQTAPDLPFAQFTAPVLQKGELAQAPSGSSVAPAVPAAETSKVPSANANANANANAASAHGVVAAQPVAPAPSAHAPANAVRAQQPQQQAGNAAAATTTEWADEAERSFPETMPNAQIPSQSSGLSLGNEFNDSAPSTVSGRGAERAAAQSSRSTAANQENPQQGAPLSQTDDSGRVEIGHSSRDYLAGEYDEMPATASFQEFEQAFAEKDVAVPSFMDPWKTQERAQQEASATAHSANRYEVSPSEAASDERVAIEVEFHDAEPAVAHQTSEDQVIDEQPVSADSEAADEYAAEAHARDTRVSVPTPSKEPLEDDPYAVTVFDSGTTPRKGSAASAAQSHATLDEPQRTGEPSRSARAASPMAEPEASSTEGGSADSVAAQVIDSVENEARETSNAAFADEGDQPSGNAVHADRADEPAPHCRRTIALPHVGMTGRLPFASHSKQRAPLADAGTKGGKSAAKGLLSTLPSIDADNGGATKNPSRSGVLRSLKDHLPSTAARDDDDTAGASGSQTAVSSVGSFGAAGATGAFAPVGDELLDDVAPDDIYVDDADDSDLDENYTETGAFAGPGYVDMPKSHFRNFFSRFHRKAETEYDEQSPQEWLNVDEQFDPREEGRKRGGWESFNEEPNSSAEDDAAGRQERRATGSATQTRSAGGSQSNSASNAAEASERAREEGSQPADAGEANAWNQGNQPGTTYDYATGTAYGAGAYGSESYVSGVYSDEVYGEERVGEAGDFGSARPEVKPGDTSPFLPAVSVKKGKQHHHRRNHKNSSWQGGGFSTDRATGEGESYSEGADAAAVDDEVERIYQFKEDPFDTEVWFVALGSEQDYHDGVRQFAASHADDLRGAVVIDIESLGRGKLSLPQQEGSLRTKKISARMKRFVKKASSETGVPVATKDVLREESAASILSRQGVQAMHLVGIDGNAVAAKGDAADMYENLDMNKLQDDLGLILALLKQI